MAIITLDEIWGFFLKITCRQKITITVNNSTPTPKKCDFNNDGKITTADLFKVLGNINKTVPTNTMGDCTGDGKVTTLDLFQLSLSNYFIFLKYL